MRILIVDDHALFRLGLEAILYQIIPGADVRLAADVPAALELLQSARFDVILLDWKMPGVHGFEALDALRGATPHGHVVVLSGDCDPALIYLCLERGASGFIAKDTAPAQLTAALEVIKQGGIVLPASARVGLDASALTPPPAMFASSPAQPQRVRMMTLAERYPQLTGRQQDVLHAAARGLTNKVIARELGISEDTVKQHLGVAYQVLGVRTRAEAIVTMAQQGLRLG